MQRPQSLYSSPWLGGRWTLRDQVEYMKTASIATIEYAAKYKNSLLYNRYLAGKAQIAQEPGTDQTPRFVTGSLQVDYKKPTPAGQELLLTGKAVEIGERKVIVEVSFRAGETETARGRVIAVRIPPTMAKA